MRPYHHHHYMDVISSRYPPLFVGTQRVALDKGSAGVGMHGPCVRRVRMGLRVKPAMTRTHTQLYANVRISLYERSRHPTRTLTQPHTNVRIAPSIHEMAIVWGNSGKCVSLQMVPCVPSILLIVIIDSWLVLPLHPMLRLRGRWGASP